MCALTNRSDNDPEPWLMIDTEKVVCSPTCGISVEISNDSGTKVGSGVRSLTFTPLTAIAKGWLDLLPP